jgi:hypothetical protein
MGKRPLERAMGELRRSLEQVGDRVRHAAETAAESAESSDSGSSHNVATAINVGRSGRVRGVSVKQRTRVRKDGTRVVETIRKTYGDDDGDS